MEHKSDERIGPRGKTVALYGVPFVQLYIIHAHAIGISARVLCSGRMRCGNDINNKNNNHISQTTEILAGKNRPSARAESNFQFQFNLTSTDGPTREPAL